MLIGLFPISHTKNVTLLYYSSDCCLLHVLITSIKELRCNYSACNYIIFLVLIMVVTITFKQIEMVIVYVLNKNANIYEITKTIFFFTQKLINVAVKLIHWRLHSFYTDIYESLRKTIVHNKCCCWLYII